MVVLKRTDGFSQDAIALTSGLSRKQVTADLSVGLSMPNKWVTAHRDTDVLSDHDLERARENEPLRRENRMIERLWRSLKYEAFI